MSWRTAPLPPDWAAIRARVLARDGGRCTERLPNGTRCPFDATDVHHIVDSHDHSDANLRSLCDWHHKQYTSAQGNAARTRVTQKRPTEKHPGVK